MGTELGQDRMGRYGIGLDRTLCIRIGTGIRTGISEGGRQQHRVILSLPKKHNIPHSYVRAQVRCEFTSTHTHTFFDLFIDGRAWKRAGEREGERRV